VFAVSHDLHRLCLHAVKRAPNKQHRPSLPSTVRVLLPLQLGGAGGLPADGRLVREAKVWQPPAAIKPPPPADSKRGGEGGTPGPPFPVGQVPGVASAGNGTVWIFHRGNQAWQATGAVGNASSADEADAVLAGPTVAQARRRCLAAGVKRLQRVLSPPQPCWLAETRLVLRPCSNLPPCTSLHPCS
jgi:hypothetical protein